MLAPYRNVLSIPGALAFTTAGFLSRLPISMVTLGIVLLVADRTGSYGQAGVVTAAYIVTTSASSPLLARAMDRVGQRLVVLPCVVAFGLALSALIVTVDLGAPAPLPHLCAALAGASYPPIGSCVRARWSYVVKDPAVLHTAFSFEAVVDESIFMVGPVLVTVLATGVSESLALVSVIVVALAGGAWFASLRATQPPPNIARTDRARSPISWRWMAAVVTVSAALGSLFGSTEVVTVAFAKEQGHPEVTGLLLATWASGSLISGVITGLLTIRADPRTRFRWGAAGMAVVMIPLPFVDRLSVLAVVLFIGGFAISPTLVATMSLVKSGVPADRLTEGITWVSTGIGIGLAPGAAIAGHLVDVAGASTAYVVPVVSGVLAAVVAWSTGGRGTSALTEPGQNTAVRAPGNGSRP